MFYRLKYYHFLVVIISTVIVLTGWLILHDRNEIYLYAWERPESFSFLGKNSNVTVVFYAGDVVTKDGKATVTPRRNSLFIPTGIKSFPLIRIDSFDSPSNLVANIDKISDFIVNICEPYEEGQLDFEARTSEYDFYLGLMDKIRAALPDKKVSVTALASWCSGKGLLDDLYTQVAVPMLYRMGRDGTAIKNGEVGYWFLSNSKCNDSIALSIDELDFDHSRYSNGKSIHFFNPRPLNEDSYKKALSHL